MENKSTKSAGSYLYYRRPATDWNEALPLGNGRHGVMYFGDPKRDRLALNVDTLWSGYPECWRDTAAYDGYNDDRDRSAAWKKIQALTIEGEYAEAETLYQQEMVGPNTQSYLPLGDLYLDFDGPVASEVSDYHRDLDLCTGVASMRFTADGASHVRRLFVSEPDQMAVMELETEASAGMDVTLRQTSPWLVRNEAELLGDGRARLLCYGLAPSEVMPAHSGVDPGAIRYRLPEAQRGMRLMSIAYLETDGKLAVTEAQSKTYYPASGEGLAEERSITVDALRVTGAREIRIYWSAETSYNGFDKQPYTEGRDEGAELRARFRKKPDSPAVCLARHIEDYRSFYDRLEFRLGQGDEDPYRDLTDRLASLSRGEEDRALYVLLFNYSRYLMIAGSRPGTQALNLQGIWNQEVRPPWSSNYTVNINTEMNYWPAEVLNLAECAQPLLDLIRGVAVTGQRTAEIYYGAAGFVLHHNTDLWRHSRPVSCDSDKSLVWAGWPLGSAWLLTHLRRHRIYTDPTRLADDYEILRAGSMFYLEQLQVLPDGRLVFSPSTSPEHWYKKDGRTYVISKAAAMTQGLLVELFGDTIEAGELTGADPRWLEKLRETRDKLALYQISSAVPGMEGTLQEWYDDCPEGDIAHRHVSHLYGLFPGRTIHRGTPAWREAARQSMIRRTDEGTGWSLGWKTALWARLEDGDHALAMIRRQLRPVDIHGHSEAGGGGSYANLLDAHPPFQIDGNFANGAAVAEFFCQVEQDDILYLLPALPTAWQEATLHGLRAPYGLEMNFDVSGGALRCLTLRNRGEVAHTWTLRYRGQVLSVTLAAGEAVVLDSFAN